jgi:hypothetical protein
MDCDRGADTPETMADKARMLKLVCMVFFGSGEGGWTAGGDVGSRTIWRRSNNRFRGSEGAHRSFRPSQK